MLNNNSLRIFFLLTNVESLKYENQFFGESVLPIQSSHINVDLCKVLSGIILCQLANWPHLKYLHRNKNSAFLSD